MRLILPIVLLVTKVYELYEACKIKCCKLRSRAGCKAGE